MMARQQPGARPKKAATKKRATATAGSGGEFTTKRGRGKSSEGAGEKAGVPPISNYRPPSSADTDLFRKFAKMAESQDKAVEKAVKALQSARQELGQIYRQAKEEGIPAERVAQLKKTIKERKRDAAEILVEERERAWQHSTLESQLAEVLPFFETLTAPPTLTEIEIMGEHAGKNNEPPENNPYKPGSAPFTHWESGRKKGQRASAGKVFGDDDKGQGDGTGGEAPAGNVVRLA
jgi:hypothetical protein